MSVGRHGQDETAGPGRERNWAPSGQAAGRRTVAQPGAQHACASPQLCQSAVTALAAAVAFSLRHGGGGGAPTMPLFHATGFTSRSLRPLHRLQVNFTSSERRGRCRSMLTPSPSALPAKLPSSLSPE